MNVQYSSMHKFEYPRQHFCVNTVQKYIKGPTNQTKVATCGRHLELKEEEKMIGYVIFMDV